MAKTIVNRSQFNLGIKKIKERLYGERGLKNILQKGGEVELRKVLALVDRALDEERTPRNYQIDEQISATVKDYLNLFDEIIPRPEFSENLEFEICEMVKEHGQSLKVSNKIKIVARSQMSFLNILMKSPKAWATSIWIVSIYFILKKYFPRH